MVKLQPGELYEKIDRLSLHLTNVVYPNEETMKNIMLRLINEVKRDYRDTFNIVKAFDLEHPSIDSKGERI